MIWIFVVGRLFLSISPVTLSKLTRFMFQWLAVVLTCCGWERRIRDPVQNVEKFTDPRTHYARILRISTPYVRDIGVCCVAPWRNRAIPSIHTCRDSTEVSAPRTCPWYRCQHRSTLTSHPVCWQKRASKFPQPSWEHGLRRRDHVDRM